MNPDLRKLLIAERDACLTAVLENQRKADQISALLEGAPVASDLMMTRSATSSPGYVIAFLKEHPGVLYTPSEISAALAQKQGRENTKNFYTSIYVTCQRIAPRFITEGVKGGVKAYMHKP